MVSRERRGNCVRRNESAKLATRKEKNFIEPGLKTEKCTVCVYLSGPVKNPGALVITLATPLLDGPV